MTIQDQAPDLSICQLAKEKGVEIESKFWWNRLSDCPDGKEDWVIIDSERYGRLVDKMTVVPAPLTDEILKKLPEKIIPELSGGEDFSYLIIVKDKDFYTVGYDGGECIFETVQDKKLSNALYLLYMKLKETGII